MQPKIRVPPKDVDMEVALLGALLINEDIKPAVRQLINADDFYLEAHQHLYDALQTVQSDLPTVINWLRGKGLLEKSGGPDYCAQIISETSTSAGWKHYCQIIKEFSRRRRIIGECYASAEKAFDETIDINETLDEHKASIRELQADERPDYTPVNTIISNIFHDIERRKESGNRMVGVGTGFYDIDERTGGLEPGTSTYLIARPSIGKTAIALNIAEHVASEDVGAVLFFAHEAGEVPLMRRRLSSHSNIYLSRLRSGDISNHQWGELISASNTLVSRPLIIFDRSKFTYIENLASMCETMAMEKKIALIVIDHLQLMYSKKRTQNRHLEISYISSRLKDLFKELKAPGLVLCQLNREVEKAKNKRPILSSIRESGDVEQNADQVWGLYREDKDATIAELECLKGRDTGTWKTWLSFDRFIQRFTQGSKPDDLDILKGNKSWV